MLEHPNLAANPAIRRILIIKWSAMGDVIIATALFEDIARAFPSQDIHLNISPTWQHLFVSDPRFQHVFAVDLRNRQQRLAATWSWIKQVRAGHYDLIIDLQSNDRSRILLTLLWLSGTRIPYRIGNNRQWPYNISPPPGPLPKQAQTRMHAALQAGGIPTSTPRPVLHLAKHHRVRAQQLLSRHDLQPGHYAIFLPGCNANGHLKRWGAARYSALAHQLHQQGLQQIVLIGGPDEIEECQLIAETCGSWLVNLCGQTEILDIPPLCESACFIVANDTGTAHLASTTTTPITVICGPTDPRRVKPLGDNVTTLQADLPCINCYLKTCSHHSCMSMITPSRVLQHVRVTARPNPSSGLA
jgi:heptosyltransferase-2